MDNNKPFEVNRRTVVRTAAWSAPVAAVVAGAAPSFATSPTTPNLSTSTVNTAPTRSNTGTITMAANSATFKNTGTEALGLVAVISLANSNITDVRIGGMPYAQFAPLVTVTGLGTNSVTLTIDAAAFTIPANGSTDLPLDLEFDTNSTAADTLTVEATAGNGGDPTAFAAVPLAAHAAPNLSTSAPKPPTRKTANSIDVPPATFNNTGSVGTKGIRVTIDSPDNPITNITAFGAPVTNFGITYEPGFAPGPTATKIIMRTGSGLSDMTIPANGSKTAAAGQVFTFANPLPVTFQTTVEPIVTLGSAPDGVPARFPAVTVN